MFVTVTGFGSVWRRRFGKDQSDPRRFAHAAYFNTTEFPSVGRSGAGPGLSVMCDSMASEASTPIIRLE